MTRQDIIDKTADLARRRASAQEMVELCRGGVAWGDIRHYQDIIEHCDFEISQLASVLTDEDFKILDEVLKDYLEPDDIPIRLP